MSDNEQDVLLEDAGDGVRVLRLNRPERLNALARETTALINRRLDEVARDKSCRVLVITGEGRAFCAGMDVKAANERNRAAVSEGPVVKYASQEAHAGMAARVRALKPAVIAAVNGPAVGAGLALALAADVRIASPEARFLIGAIRIGLSASESGISYHLPRLIGAGRAFEVMLTGRPIDAEEAERIGLVSRIAPPGALMETTLELARTIAGHSPFAIQQTKQVMWANLDAGGLADALELENRAQILTALTEDYKEATAAFAEKRTPRFAGR